MRHTRPRVAVAGASAKRGTRVRHVTPAPNVSALTVLPADIAATRPYMNAYGGQLYALYKSHSLTAKIDKTLPEVALSSVINVQRFDYSAPSDYDFTRVHRHRTFQPDRLGQPDGRRERHARHQFVIFAPPRTVAVELTGRF